MTDFQGLLGPLKAQICWPNSLRNYTKASRVNMLTVRLKTTNETFISTNGTINERKKSLGCYTYDGAKSNLVNANTVKIHLRLSPQGLKEVGASSQ